MSEIAVGKKVIEKLYSCKKCGVTMLLESFTDEQTTLEMIKQNPYCLACESMEGSNE